MDDEARQRHRRRRLREQAEQNRRDRFEHHFITPRTRSNIKIYIGKMACRRTDKTRRRGGGLGEAKESSARNSTIEEGATDVGICRSTLTKPEIRASYLLGGPAGVV